jgi:hypothetical protein
VYVPSTVAMSMIGVPNGSATEERAWKVMV